ncbi:MAG: hypothetical protein AAF217_00005, partial [Pseudomonadota bacterium]
MTKWKGKVASLSPCLALFMASVSASAISLSFSIDDAHAGGCTPLGGPGTYICTGPANAVTDTTQVLNSGVVPLNITTSNDFGIDTSTNGGTGLDLSSLNSITFTQSGTGGITGDTYGIYARNSGTGALSVTATGTITGIVSNGVDAGNNNAAGAGELTVSAAAVTGAIRGIFARNAGTGVTSVTATGTVTGTASNGVDARNYNAAGAGDLTVSTAAVTGGTYGIYARNVGTGALSVTATGTVTGTGNNGVDARNYNAAGAGDLSVSTAAVTGAIKGIFAGNAGTGATSVTATGTVTGIASNGVDARNYNAAGAGELTV